MNQPAYELYRDHYKLLQLLVEMVCEKQGVPPDFENIPEYEDDTFVLRPFREGDARPNFLYKPKQVEIRWYGFFGRDIQCNQDLTRDDYNQMIVDCLSSLYGMKNGN